MKLYKEVPLEEGRFVQYVGVYVLDWKKEWGPSEIGFIEVSSDEIRDNWNSIVDNEYIYNDLKDDEVELQAYLNNQ